MLGLGRQETTYTLSISTIQHRRSIFSYEKRSKSALVKHPIMPSLPSLFNRFLEPGLFSFTRPPHPENCLVFNLSPVALTPRISSLWEVPLPVTISPQYGLPLTNVREAQRASTSLCAYFPYFRTSPQLFIRLSHRGS